MADNIEEAIRLLKETGRPSYVPATPEQVATHRAEQDRIHGGTYAASARFLDGEITLEESKRLIREARIRRKLRRSRSR